MADAETVLEAEAPEEDQAQDDTDVEEVEAEEAETQDATSDDETVEDDPEPEAWEFDAGGSKILVDKETLPEETAQEIDTFLKSSWSNVTKKNQELGEARKAVEARSKAIESIAGLQAEVMDEYARGMQARQELESYQGVDLNALWQSDPDQARRISDRMSQLQAQWQRSIANVDAKETEFRNAQAAEEQRRMDEGRTVMDKRIKGFSDKASEVIEYVVDAYGMDRGEAEKWPLNPITAEMAYKAMLYDKAQAKLARPAKSEPPKPMRKARGGGQRATSSGANPKDASGDKLPADEWMKRRNADLAKRNVRL